MFKHKAIQWNIIFLLFSINTGITIAEETSERFRFLLNGIKSEREKLTSGIVRGRGLRSLTIEANDKSTTKSGPVEYFFAFSYLTGKIRVDRKEPDMTQESPADFLGFGQYVERLDSIEYRYRHLYEPEDDGITFIATPKEGNYEFRNNSLCSQFDIRALGLNNLWKIQSGMTPLNERLDSMEKRVPDVFEEKDGICRFEYHERNEKYKELRKRILWVNTKNGYTIQRSLNIWELDDRKEQPWILADQRLSWKKLDGVWVPADLSIETNLPVNEKEKFVISFDWKNVNKPVDDELFHYCDFSAAELSPVVDVPFLGAQGQLKHRGSFLHLCGTKEGRLLEKQLAEKHAFRVKLPFLISGILLIIAGIVLKIYQKYKR